MADNRKGAERRQDIQAKLMRHFEQKVGQTVYVGDLAAEFAVPREAVQKGVNNLRARDGWQATVDVVVRGQAWKYLGPKGSGKDPDTEKMCFEEIGVTKEGDLIIQSEHGKLYRATAL